MSNALFGNLTTDGLEETQDRLGGFQPFDTDVYTGKIKAAYAGESSGGAKNITLLVDMPGGKEYRETVYITNKKGENFFLNKQDNSKKVPLPGFTIIDDICLIVTGKPLAQQEVEEKQFKVWDNEAKKELPKAVMMLTELVGQDIKLGILRNLENKSEKQGDSYVATAATRETNNIDKVFHPEQNLTVAEARSGQEEAKFLDAWTERNKGQVRDKREIKEGEGGGTAGAPKASNQTAAAPGKSLFPKKS